ncbi:MAG: FecR family protein [Bacteroidota bacterium]
MTPKEISILANKFLTGRASEEEITLLMKWYDSFDEQDTVIHTSSNEEAQIIKDRIKNKIFDRVIPDWSERSKPERSLVFKLSRAPWLKIAAVLVVVMIAGWLLGSRKEKPQLAVTEIAVPRKQLKKITLPDSSMVWINAESKLTYAADFNQKERIVQLEGEAYFDVKHDEGKPFIVKTTYSTTRVLGTAFNIKAYQQDSSVTVTVIRGKVQVEDAFAHTSIITPNQQVYINPNTKKIIGKTVDAQVYHSWIKDILDFNGENFYEVARILERKYNITILFRNQATANCTFIAGFDESEDVFKIIEKLCRINGSKFTTSSDKKYVMIDGTGCE